jgi:multiple sugar transport system substrate-binding protein
MSMTNTDTSLRADFIVDSAFPGIGKIINDVIPKMTQPVLFDGKSADETLSECQKLADDIVGEYNE